MMNVEVGQKVLVRWGNDEIGLYQPTGKPHRPRDAKRTTDVRYRLEMSNAMRALHKSVVIDRVSVENRIMPLSGNH